MTFIFLVCKSFKSNLRLHESFRTFLIKGLLVIFQAQCAVFEI